MIRLDETKYWGIENPEDVRAGDIVFAISGNQYRAKEHGLDDLPDGELMVAPPDSSRASTFPMPFDRFDFALRHKPVGDGWSDVPLDEYRPARTYQCPDCGRTDAWHNDGVVRIVAGWWSAWRCACGRRFWTWSDGRIRDAYLRGLD